MMMLNTGEEATARAVLRVTGADRVSFLQGLVTNDLTRLDRGALYAALLSPQGKYLADFIIVPDGDAILVDIDAALAPDVVRRLTLYRLRADVQISPTDLHVRRGLGPVPDGAYADPRHPALGWRACCPTPGTPPRIDWDAIRVAHMIPEAGKELQPGESYILEAGFEALHGVDFRKGCYVGQEVTARMKHRTELRKGLVRLCIDGEAAPGTPIEDAEGRVVGTLHTQAGGRALAHLRHDRLGPGLRAGSARLQPE